MNSDDRNRNQPFSLDDDEEFSTVPFAFMTESRKAKETPEEAETEYALPEEETDEEPEDETENDDLRIGDMAKGVGNTFGTVVQFITGIPKKFRKKATSEENPVQNEEWETSDDEEDDQPDNEAPETGDNASMEERILVEQFFRLSDYEGQAKQTMQFMKDCYYNTFRITLPEAVFIPEKFEIPSVFRSFYLHFEFSEGENTLRQDIVQKDFEWSRRIEGEDTEEPKIFYIAKVSYLTTVKKKVPKQELKTFEIQFCFEVIGEKIQKMTMTIPVQNQTFIKRISSKSSKKTTASNHSCFVWEFGFTTMRNALYFSGGEELEIGGKKYHLNVSCYANFTRLVCPVCQNEVHDLGIRGIIPYRNSGTDYWETSNRILDFLENLSQCDPEDENVWILEMVRYVIVENYMNNRSIPEERRLKREEIDEMPLKQLKSNIRIPLAWYNPRSEKNKLKPFTWENEEQELALLRKLNEHICPSLRNMPNPPKGLYLLKPTNGNANINSVNSYTHNVMIGQLCNCCFNPLPENFYHYDEVITIFYFGNSNAGKTVLLCSEYAVIERDNRQKKSFEQILNKFNTIYVDSANDVSYSQKSAELQEGYFPQFGTSIYDEIPGKLSSLKINYNGKNLQWMFNACDMPGVESVRNWSSYTSFSYVHTLLDDPLFLGKDSFYGMLGGIIPAERGTALDSRTYNIQIYLTKADEYPNFLYKKIKELNEAWKEWRKSVYYSGDYRRNVLIYTYCLLEILETQLRPEKKRRDLWKMRAKDVIPENIMKAIISILPSSLEIMPERNQTYGEVHQKIVDECIIREDDPTASAILNYLHGVDVLQDNYTLLRRRIVQLVTDMSINTHESYGNYYLAIYAISATGYSKIESLRGEASYSPEFVLESSEMLRNTTFEYENELRSIQNTETAGDGDEGNGDDKEGDTPKLQKYLFDEIKFQEEDFMQGAPLNGQSFCEAVEKLLPCPRSEKLPCTKYDENYSEYLENLELPDSVKRLSEWYAKKHFSALENEVQS